MSRKESDGSRRLKALGLSNTRIADAVGVSMASVVHWKHGRVRPAIPMRDALERLFQIPAAAWEPAVDLSPVPVDLESELALSDPFDDLDDEPTPRPIAYEQRRKREISPSTIEGVRELLLDIYHDLNNGMLTPAQLSKLRSDEVRALSLLSRLEREQELLEERIVHMHPSWQKLKTKILDALRPYPDASKAVLEAVRWQPEA